MSGVGAPAVAPSGECWSGRTTASMSGRPARPARWTCPWSLATGRREILLRIYANCVDVEPLTNPPHRDDQLSGGLGPATQARGHQELVDHENRYEQGGGGQSTATTWSRSCGRRQVPRWTARRTPHRDDRRCRTATSAPDRPARKISVTACRPRCRRTNPANLGRYPGRIRLVRAGAAPSVPPAASRLPTLAAPAPGLT